MTPFFSVIIPTYNRADKIRRAISSAQDQTYTLFEVIIVDDGSTDNTREVIESINDPRVRYFHQSNSERAAARNYGAQLAKGDYITFLDSDDILYRNYLSNAAGSLKKYDFPPFYHQGYEIKTEDGKVIDKITSIRSDTYKFLIYGNPLSCLGVFIKRPIFLAHKFNEDRDLSKSEDWELWLRMVANFGIKTDNRISAAMISHADRGVLDADEPTLVMRKKLSLEYAFNDEKVKERFHRSLRVMGSHFDTYISLHLALAGKKRRALHFLGQAFLTNPKVILKKRFYAIVEKLFSI